MPNNIEDTCKRIEKYFYIHKPIKKKTFLTAIKSLIIFFKLYNYSYPKERTSIFRLIYIYFRDIDDIIDGDKILETSNLNFDEYKKIVKEYINERIIYIKNGCTSKTSNELDEMMKVILQLNEKLNLELKDDFIKLLECMFFDLERKCDLKNSKINLSSKEEIDKFFFRYYYESCIKIAVKLTSPNYLSVESKNIKDLGYAQRIYFNLEDFFEDLSFGIINIPYQDIRDLGINEQSLINIANSQKNLINLCKRKGFNDPNVSKFIDEPIVYWLNQQLDLGIEHLKTYQKNAPLRTITSVENELLFKRSDFSEIILRMGIERGTNQYLSKLKKQRDKQNVLNRR